MIGFNLAIEILIVDTRKVELFPKIRRTFQSRDRDSYS